MADGCHYVAQLAPGPLRFTLIDEPVRTAPRDPLEAISEAARNTGDPSLERDLRGANQAVRRLVDFLDANVGVTLIPYGNESRQRLSQLLADVRGISGNHDQG